MSARHILIHKKRDHINYGLIAVSFPFLLFRLDLNQRPSD